ncbi:hypothetical protein M404DRAFT_9538 [Pisolithus tinctorius Marx 270]|uniref:Uncharacterized protein n=1 Tax=Pisolithus tinctorius Marx 270 TaxID=870435 RepID=A0A0C3NRQ4_PISTI|nr:hypothetical protein M404DRAFT_9538 [Pisolithus tinctorius Marx 270]
MAPLLNCSADEITSRYPESEEPNNASDHSLLERCLEDVCQKIAEVKEIQEQLVDDKHVIAAKVESMQYVMKSVGETLRDHEGQLCDLDDTQRRVAEEFSNLEKRLASLQKIRIRKDASLKEIQTSLENLETNLASCRRDLQQQVRDKHDDLHQCITDSLSGLQSSQLSLDERLTILEEKADGIRAAQDKHMAFFSQTLAGIHSLSQGFMTLLDHTHDIGPIRVALCDMQEAMESVKKSLEQISGDGISDVSQGWAQAQLSLEEELLCSTRSFPTTPSGTAFTGSEEAGPEDSWQCTAAAPSSDDWKPLCGANMFCYPNFQHPVGDLVDNFRVQDTPHCRVQAIRN